MWSALGISEHKALWGASNRRVILNGGWLNSRKLQNLNQMSYISVIGEECRIHEVFCHLRTFWRKKERKKRHCSFLFCIKFDLHSWQFCQCCGCSGSLREEHSNDLVTVTRKTISSSFVRGEETWKRARLPGVVLCWTHVDGQEELHRYNIWLQRLPATCILLHYFWRGAINKSSWYTALCADGLKSMSKSEKTDVCHGQSESGHSV